MGSPELVLFDLDGTLVDSVPDIAAAVDTAMLALGFPAPGEAHVRAWVGNGARVLMARALADVGAPELIDDAHERFLDAYGETGHRRSRLYPGVAEMLLVLKTRAIALAICTNKPSRFVGPLLNALGIAEYFSAVLGGDELLEKKPHPAPLLHLAQRFGVSAERCLMVGDSSNDVLAARAAGMPVVAVSYGYNHGEAIAASAPDRILDSLAELPDLLRL